MAEFPEEAQQAIEESARYLAHASEISYEDALNRVVEALRHPPHELIAMIQPKVDESNRWDIATGGDVDAGI